MIRDRIVLGVRSQRVRERLLREDDLDLGKAIKICQAAEVTERQIETLSQKFSEAKQMSTTTEGATTQSISQCRRTQSKSLRPTSPSVVVVTRRMRPMLVRLSIILAMRAESKDISHACADRNRRCDTCHVTKFQIQQSCLLGW